MMLAISAFQLTNIILVVIFLFLGFKFLETNWSYKISKPFVWDAAVKNGDISKKLKTIERFYRDKVRFYTFWLQIERLKKENVLGEFAEVGVYKGETARMIHAMDPARRLHLFDTFEGFNARDLEGEMGDHAQFNAIDFSDTNIELVTKVIDGNENIMLHKGYFPETAKNLNVEKFAFVHLDADLYQPTIAALRYFYPRLSAGAILIIHDYNHTWEGVRKAIDEFKKDIPEKFIEIPDWQGSVMIVRNRIE